jgi:hypothetical protein
VRPRGARDALDPLAGYTLGQLLLRYRACPSDPGAINPQQHDAGQALANLARRHAALMGYSLGSPQSPPLVFTGRGVSSTKEPAKREIERITGKWDACLDALTAVGVTHHAPVREITYAVCIENRRAESLTPLDYGNLRIGLNAIAKVLGFTDFNAVPQARAAGP